MSATSSQTRPNVKQAVASFNRRHYAASSQDDQFRVASYVVHTPPPAAPTYTYTSPSSSPPVALSQRQTSRITCFQDHLPQQQQQHQQHPANHQLAVVVRAGEQPPAHVPTSSNGHANRHQASSLNGSAATVNGAGCAQQQLNRLSRQASASATACSPSITTITNNIINKLHTKSSSPISSLPSPSRILGPAPIKSSSPVFVVDLPNNYRKQQPISPSWLPSQQNEPNQATMGDYLSTPHLSSSRIPPPQDGPTSSPKQQTNCHTAFRDQLNLSSQSDSDSTPKFHYKRRIPATIATTAADCNRLPAVQQAPSNNRCEITPRLPRGISRIPHQIYQARKQARGDEGRSEYNQEDPSETRDETRFLTYSKFQASSHASCIKKSKIGDAQSLVKQTTEGREQETRQQFCENEAKEFIVVEPEDFPISNLITNPRPTSPPPPPIDSQQPIPVERQLIKSRDSSASRAIHVASAPDYHSSKSSFSNEIEAFPKTASSSSSCRQQPICEAFIMTGQSMLKLSCTETNNNNNNNCQTMPNGNNIKKLQEEQETRLDNSPVSVKVDNQLGTGTNNNVEAVGDKTMSADVGSIAFESVMDCAQEPQTRAEISIDDPRTAVTAAGTIVVSKEATTSTTSKHLPDSTTVEEHLVDGEEEDKEEINAKEEKEEEEANCIRLAAPVCHPKSAPTTPDNMGDKTSLIDEMSSLSSSNVPTVATGGCTYDLDSAKRLAKRLYTLSGFKKSDVSHHLGKSNQFSEMVAEEYLNLFDFKSMKLDAALRKFLSKFHLNGETQERERILSRFSQRYYICNSDKFPSSDIVQTLVCALILLNTDLHGRHRGKNKSKRSTLSLGAFIDGLNSSVVTLAAAVADENLENSDASHQLSGATGYTLPRHILVDLYESIKKKPLKSNEENCDMSMFESELDKIYSQHQNNQAACCRSSTLPTRRFLPTGSSMAAAATMNCQTKHRYRLGLSKLNLFDNNNKPGAQTVTKPADDKTIQPIQFKSGYLNRKRTLEANGRPTVKGKRGWARVHVMLVDLNLIFQLGIKDSQEEFRFENQKAAIKQMKNGVKIYHSIAKPATTYKKRNFVFHLELADQSEFLLQASDLNEMTAWIETINFASACLSAPVLPTPISSKSSSSSSTSLRKMDRRLTPPASYTKLKYWDQLVNHEERLQKLRLDLDEHLASAPNTKSAKKSCKNRFIERIAYLRHEIQRYSVYVDLMRKRSNSNEAMVLSGHAHLTTSLAPSDKMIKLLPNFGPAIEGQAQLEFTEAT